MSYNFYYTNIGVAITDLYYIGSVLYLDAFADINTGAKFDEIITELLGGSAYEQLAETYYGDYQKLVFE